GEIIERQHGQLEVRRLALERAVEGEPLEQIVRVEIGAEPAHARAQALAATAHARMARATRSACSSGSSGNMGRLTTVPAACSLRESPAGARSRPRYAGWRWTGTG